MATLLFLATIVTLLILLANLTAKLIKRKNIATTLKAIALVTLSYFSLWCFFYFISNDVAVPLGTDICFDDWCITVTKIEKTPSIEKDNEVLAPNEQFVILHIKISNHARGIAQKPSKPRVHIIDEKGSYWSVSDKGQHLLEKTFGQQVPIDQKLELNQSLETQLVFEIPKNAEKIKVLIEEGPFITKFLLPDDRKVFLVN